MYINGLHIIENDDISEKYTGPRILGYHVKDEPVGDVSPYVLCEKVVAKGVYTESGIPTYLSFNEGDYPDTVWEISDSNIVEGYLPRS